MNLESSFQKLIKDDKLSHSYIFFGNPDLNFIKKLANFLENKKWDLPETTLLDFLIITPASRRTEPSGDNKGVINNFLWKKPLKSSRKVLVIEKADNLTLLEQNAILKISEEPPSQSLIFLLVSDPAVLIAPLASRFQKIYNARSIEKENILPEAREFLMGNLMGRNAIIKSVTSDDDLLEKFVRSVMLELDKDPIKNFKALKELTYRWSLIRQHNTNKKLQLESWLQSFTG